jgi:Zn-dependent peptidase ImmA (M78 family)
VPSDSAQGNAGRPDVSHRMPPSSRAKSRRRQQSELHRVGRKRPAEARCFPNCRITASHPPAVNTTEKSSAAPPCTDEINRRELPGRRHLDLAHELFHLLTWDAMPPQHVEEVAPKRRSRVEQLADSFASAVLMPAPVLDRFGEWAALENDDLIARLNATADELAVTASALRRRLMSLGRLHKSVGNRIPEDEFRHGSRTKPAEDVLPPLFSQAFIEVVARAIDQGQVTVRRISHLLGLSADDLADLFKTYGIEAPFVL